MNQYEILDGERVIRFNGRLLSSVTSWEQGKRRWIELSLYKTEAGSYVLAGCGRSNVVGEVDRRWVQVADEPAGVIDRLYLYSDTGARYIPRTSQTLLRAASECDPALERAYSIEHVA